LEAKRGIDWAVSGSGGRHSVGSWHKMVSGLVKNGGKNVRASTVQPKDLAFAFVWALD